jgi:hypothetical protein
MTIHAQRPPLASQLRRIAALVGFLAIALAAPLAAHADDHWHHGGHRHGHWHGRGWAPVYVGPRFYGPRPYVYGPGPGFYPYPAPVYVAPPPVYVAPPPVYYGGYYGYGRPQVGVSLGFNWFSH